jgi:hypothetical protein
MCYEFCERDRESEYKQTSLNTYDGRLQQQQQNIKLIVLLPSSRGVMARASGSSAAPNALYLQASANTNTILKLFVFDFSSTTSSPHTIMNPIIHDKVKSRTNLLGTICALWLIQGTYCERWAGVIFQTTMVIPTTQSKLFKIPTVSVSSFFFFFSFSFFVMSHVS